MDEILFGRGFKALRIRKGKRQEDLAADAGVSRGAVARIEQGHAASVTVGTLEKLAGQLGARVVCRLLWQGEGLDRLLDATHAAIVEQVVRILTGLGWEIATEVSFNHFGERGSIDVLAFHPTTRALLVVEVKSVVPDVQATLVTLDRKERLAPHIARGRGWDAVAVGRLLVIRDDRTARRRSAGPRGPGAPRRGMAVASSTRPSPCRGPVPLRRLTGLTLPMMRCVLGASLSGLRQSHGRIRDTGRGAGVGALKRRGGTGIPESRWG